MLRLGNVVLQNSLLMAPMAGITSLPFRLIVKRFGADLVSTEMVSAAGLARKQPRTLDYLRTDPGEGPLSVQIFGSEPGAMAVAARAAVDCGAGVVDINMGCPVRKVVKTGAGAALLRDPALAGKIVNAVRRAVEVPVTVKIRSGWSKQKPNAREVSQAAESAGADAVIVHPRAATQGFSGSADWSVIRSVKERIEIPVIGNGDVRTPGDAQAMREVTGCDGVMIGRAAVGNPWIFHMIRDMERGRSPMQPDLAARRQLIQEHFDALCNHVGSGRAAGQMRGLLMWYTRGLPGSRWFRGQVGGVKDAETLNRVLDSYFSFLEETA